MSDDTPPHLTLSAQKALQELNERHLFSCASSARLMDLIGDYAGNELFVIDGESLFQNVLDDVLLAIGRDGDPSFQILHAKYILEKMLSELKNRTANFEIVMWKVTRHLTLQTGESKYRVTSRMFARTLLYKHLQKLGYEPLVFENLDDPQWKKYRNDKRPMFIMTNDGGIIEDQLSKTTKNIKAKQILIQRIFFFEVLCSGMPIALLNGAEYRDSKILTFIYEHRRQSKNHQSLPIWAAGSKAAQLLDTSLNDIYEHPQPSNSQTIESMGQVLFQVAWNMLKEPIGDTSTLELLYLFLGFMLILPNISVRDRAREQEALHPILMAILTNTFLPTLFITASGIISTTCLDFDFDGRMFCSFLHYLTSRPDEDLSTSIGVDSKNKVNEIWTLLGSPDIDLISFITKYPPPASPPSLSSHQIIRIPKTIALLPFENQVFLEQLGSLDLPVLKQNTKVYPNDSFVWQDIPYREALHWHSRRNILPPHLGGNEDQKVDERTRTRRLRTEQRFMARMQDLATTLLGIHLEPIVISSSQLSSKSKSNKEPPKENKAVKKGKTSKPKLSSADRIRQEIAEKNALSTKNKLASWWQTELERLSKMTNERKWEHLDGLLRNSKAENQHLGLEIRLYRLNIEFLLWIDEPEPDSSVTRDNHVLSIIRQIKEITDQRYMTPQVSEILSSILGVLGFQEYSEVLIGQCRLDEKASPLAFEFKKLLASGKTLRYPYMRITEDPVRWQLRLFGDFMDRSMDSAPDERVPFKPDAWQRKVLDGIDARSSLLVVAPTSAGKTFISFYAMEKVLRESNDGVLVYIAPTKALVSQVAAEVNARFSKDVPQGHIWAIHTRDYRIHNPLTCQILITVPEVLMIMLLSPPLASVWTPRVKWIILDEIHSIGQEGGGAVWEQIVLLAPSPIIGLSATIGSPENFNSWLESVQKSHGFNHQFIHHPHRYSHLRKFYYDLSERHPEREFEGFLKHCATNRTRFLHPISFLSFGPRVIPDDLAFEASDMLTMYDSLPPRLKEIKKLDPTVFFSSKKAFLQQADILQYEKELKDVAESLLREPNAQDFSSEISLVIRKLEDPKIACLDNEERLLKLNEPSTDVIHSQLIYFLADLNKEKKLPAILFNFNRNDCEEMAKSLLIALTEAETKWRQSDPKWQKKLKDWEEWKIIEEKSSKKMAKMKNDDKREESFYTETSPWASFNPKNPLPDYSFANTRMNYTLSDLESDIEDLVRFRKVSTWVLKALKRGIGIHHSGMNKAYRTLVESLFRKGFLRIIIATGTLALGINAPAKTSVFCGDSPFLTALMYRQCAGRAGRRGYDLLGNVYFYGLSYDRVQRLVLSKLPPLGGNFPLTVTFTLRLLNLLENSGRHDATIKAIKSITSLPHISFVSDIGRHQLLHHLRFSIEYLRRSGLVNEHGQPMNLYAIAAHLYYTEPSNFVLITLIQEGVLHDIARKHSFQAKKDLMLLMAHLFGRQYLSKVFINEESHGKLLPKSPSIVILPDLPEHIYDIFNERNRQLLEIFIGYAYVYTTKYADELGHDTTLPLSRIDYSGSGSDSGSAMFTRYLHETATPTTVRSPFVATSGVTDKFESVPELIKTARSGIHLNEQMIPIFNPIKKSVGSGVNYLNAYLYDFYVHGQVESLVVNNGIRRGDVWYLLQDFLLTLKVVKFALGQLMSTISSSSQGDATPIDDMDDFQISADYAEVDMDEDGICEKSAGRPTILNEGDQKVYDLVSQVTDEFEEKFKKMWA